MKRFTISTIMRVCIALVVLCSVAYAQTQPTPPPPYDSLSLKPKGVAISNISTGSAASGLTLKSDGSGGVSVSAGSASLTNATVNGDVIVNGHVRELNKSVHFDTSYVRCLRNPNYLHFYAPDSIIKIYKDTTTLNIHYDSISAVHSSVAYFPGGFLGYKIWVAFTVRDSYGESPYIRVSNDDSNFIKFPAMPDSLDPITWKNKFVDSLGETSAYCSDPDLFPGSDGKLWIVWRQTWDNGVSVAHSALYVRSTSNGISWSAPKRITSYLYRFGFATAMSPAIWLDTAGTYKMWTDEEALGGGTNLISIHRLFLWQATYPDSIQGSSGGWSLVDTVRQYGMSGKNLYPCGTVTTGSDSVARLDDSIPCGPTGASDYQPRHIEVIDNGSDEKIVLMMAMNNRTPTAANSAFCLLIGTTSDGKTIKMRNQKLLQGSGISGTYDSSYVYRSSGWVDDQGANGALRLLYTAAGRVGTINGDFKAAITDVDFLPYVDSMQIPLSGIPTNRLSGSVTAQTKIDNVTIDTTTSGTTGQVRVKAASLTTSQLSASAGILGSQLSATAGIVTGQITDGTLTGADVANTTLDWKKMKTLYDNSTIDTTAGGLLEVKALGIAAAQIAATTITGAKVAASTLDSSKVANAGLALEDINWSASNDEYWEATKVWARDTIYAGDSVALSFPRYTGQALAKVRWDFSDSTYDVSTAEKDTITATVTIPYPFVLDSVAYKYVASTSQKIDSIRILNSNPKALSADTSITSDATDRTSTSAARVVTAASKSVGYGGCQFIIEFCVTFTANSKGHVRIGDIQFIGHRRQ